MKIRRERNRAAADGDPTKRTDEAIAKELRISVSLMRNVEHRFGTRDVSLEAPLGNNEGSTTLRDELPAAVGDPFAKAVEHELTAILRDAIKAADMAPKERRIIEARLLCRHGDEPSLAELGRQLNVTREWARRLEKRAIEKLDRELLALRQATLATVCR